jgi:hypothetical protein
VPTKVESLFLSINLQPHIASKDIPHDHLSATKTITSCQVDQPTSLCLLAPTVLSVDLKQTLRSVRYPELTKIASRQMLTFLFLVASAIQQSLDESNGHDGQRSTDRLTRDGQRNTDQFSRDEYRDGQRSTGPLKEIIGTNHATRSTRGNRGLR